MATVTTESRVLTEAEIRSDERHRVAALLVEHTELLARFATDKESLVGLIGLMIDLGE